MAPAGPWTRTAGLILSAQPQRWFRRPTGPAGTSLGASWPGRGPTAAAGGFSTATGACSPSEGPLRSLQAPTGPDGTSRRASRAQAPAQAPTDTPNHPVKDRLAPVHLSPVRDPGHYHELALVIDRVHDPIVASSNSEVITSRQLRSSGWAWVLSQGIDRSFDPVAETAMKPVIGLNGRRMQPDLEGRSALRQLASNLGPGHARRLVVPSLQRRQAVLQELQPVDELVVAVQINQDAG